MLCFPDVVKVHVVFNPVFTVRSRLALALRDDMEESMFAAPLVRMVEPAGCVGDGGSLETFRKCRAIFISDDRPLERILGEDSSLVSFQENELMVDDIVDIIRWRELLSVVPVAVPLCTHRDGETAVVAVEMA